MQNIGIKYLIKIVFAALMLSADLPAIEDTAAQTKSQGRSVTIEHIIDPTIYQNKFGYYYVPMNHQRLAVRAIKKGRIWEAKTLEYIEKIYEKGTSIIHAGTYFGDMLPFYSKLVGSNHVWAFEPAEINFICAKATRLLNKLNNVKLFQLALSNKNTQVSIQVQKEGLPLGGSSFLCEENNHNLEEIELIDSVRLDDIILNGERIGIIQLDVEGYELMALEGAQRIINEHHPILILEAWESKLVEIHQYVTSLGYQYMGTLNNNNVYKFFQCDPKIDETETQDLPAKIDETEMLDLLLIIPAGI